jgi:hypothetical protein
VPKTEDGAAFRNMLRDTYVNLKPVVANEGAAEGGDGDTGVIVAVVVAVVVVIAIVAIVLVRRRPRSVEE